MVCVESLAVESLLKNHCLAKAIADVGWGELLRQLEYKARWYGRTVVAINRWYPSSKRCVACGHELESLSLAVRAWTCPSCGTVHDRDVNAARNIKAEGLSVFACGEVVRPNLHGTREGTPRRSRKATPQDVESHPREGIGRMSSRARAIDKERADSIYCILRLALCQNNAKSPRGGMVYAAG